MGATTRFSSAIIIPLLLFSLKSSAQSSPIGMINQSSGDVTVTHQDNSVVAASPGAKLFIGDSVKTKDGGTAQLLMRDGNVFFVNESSSFLVEDYQPPSSPAGTTTLRVQGTIHAEIKRKYDDEESTFRMVTPTDVLGVRGTEFLLDHDGTQSQVTTFEGAVDVGPSMAGRKIESAVSVSKGFQYSSVGRAVKQLPETELQQLRDSAKKAGYRKTHPMEKIKPVIPPPPVKQVTAPPPKPKAPVSEVKKPLSGKAKRQQMAKKLAAKKAALKMMRQRKAAKQKQLAKGAKAKNKKRRAQKASPRSDKDNQ